MSLTKTKKNGKKARTSGTLNDPNVLARQGLGTMRRRSSQSAEDKLLGQLMKRLAYDLDAEPYRLVGGCCPPLFSDCTDTDIARLFYLGNEPFMNWLGVRRAEACRIERTFLQYTGPSGASAGTPSTGLPNEDAYCGPGDQTEFGVCDFVLEGFGELRRSTPVRINGGNSLPRCRTDPRFTIDGRQINDQNDWDMSLALNQLMDDLAIRVLVGNKNTTFDHDGLARIVKTGYTNKDGKPCPLMDSTIINWNGSPACSVEGAAGVTINGVTIEDGENLYHVLRELWYHNLERARLARLGAPGDGDVALVLPQRAINCIIECAVCWIECSGDFTRMTSEAAADRRREFMQGIDGFAAIPFDGVMVPLIPYNPHNFATNRGHMENSDGTFNMMFLWRGVGDRRVLTLEYNPLDDGTLDTNENGRFQVWQTEDGICIQTTMRTEWRVYLDAPFLQSWINNIACDTLFGTVIPGRSNAVLANRTLYPVASNC